MVSRGKPAHAGGHTLLPTTSSEVVFVPTVGERTIVSWTLGSGTVFWRVWPAVLLHTVFAAIIVTISLNTKYDMAMPNVLLTVVGVVIGFVISYRAATGYDRYWMGRCHWSDVIKNARMMARLVWFHVPPQKAGKYGEERPPEEVLAVMKEKRMIIHLIEGFAVAVKHHLRGEQGIYYEDLYPLVPVLHEHRENRARGDNKVNGIYPRSQTPGYGAASSRDHTDASGLRQRNPSGVPESPARMAAGGHEADEHQPLLPSEHPPSPRIADDLIPFSGVFGAVERETEQIVHRKQQQHYTHLSERLGLVKAKHRPVVPVGGRNIPVELIRCMSEWVALLEERGTTPGTTVGSILGCLAGFEDALVGLERILTTPLPFLYSVHIRHTVWLYLFFMPFQLIHPFEYYTIPGVAIAAFFFLGFLAAGEEIEQPFGYDENDLDLEVFTRDIIHYELKEIPNTPCANAPLKKSGKVQGGAHGRGKRHGDDVEPLVDVSDLDDDDSDNKQSDTGGAGNTLQVPQPASSTSGHVSMPATTQVMGQGSGPST